MIKGIHTALVTPIHKGAVDLASLRRLVDRQIEAGVNGLVVCATTGEGALLSPEDRRAAIGAVVEGARGRARVTVGVPDLRVDDVCRTIDVAADLGAEACLVPSPAYVKPSQDGIWGYYAKIADLSKLPIILYNVPSRTGSDILPGTLDRLASHERIVGVKEATGSIERGQQVIAAARGRLAVLSGDDPTTLSLLVAGGQGVICTGSNVTPRRWVALWKAWKSGEIHRAANIQNELAPLHEALFCETNPGPVKGALHLIGLVHPEIHLPLTWPTPSTLSRLKEALGSLGVELAQENQ